MGKRRGGAYTGFFGQCKSLRQLSTNQSSWGTEKGSREQSAVLVVGRAAAVLLALLSASATTCSTQDSCPGECHTSPAAWGRLFCLPSWHKGHYKALGERGGFFLLCTFLIQLQMEGCGWVTKPQLRPYEAAGSGQRSPQQWGLQEQVSRFFQFPVQDVHLWICPRLCRMQSCMKGQSSACCVPGTWQPRDTTPCSLLSVFPRKAKGVI